MSTMSIGLPGLLVNQRLIDLAGQNITNADTPGYHRQIGDLAARVVGASQGIGVEMTGVSRALNQLLDDAIVRNTSSTNSTGAQLDGVNQLQTYLAPGEGSLYDSVSKFFSAAEDLSNQPDSLTQRQVFLLAANDMTDRLNSLTDNLNQMHTDLLSQAKTDVDQVNTLAA